MSAPVPHPTGLVEVHVSVPDTEAAQRIATDLVARQLAACVQVLGPVASVYAWEGRVQRAEEWLLLVKTTAEALPRVVEAVRAQHRYEVPEIIAVPVVHSLAEYGDWVRDNAGGLDDAQRLE